MGNSGSSESCGKCTANSIQAKLMKINRRWQTAGDQRRREKKGNVVGRNTGCA